jgi:hypothetical protein
MSQPEEQLTLPLSVEERVTLIECEKEIARTRVAFVSCGVALQTIKESRLYREQYGTFEEYCQGKWKFSARYAYRLIMAVEIAGDIGLTPDSVQEYVIRPLVGLNCEDRKMVWKLASDEAGGQPTADQVKTIVNATVPEERKESRRKKSRAETFFEGIGLRIAFDGSIVPKGFTDDDRRQAISDLNEQRKEREAKIAKQCEARFNAPPSHPKATGPAPRVKFKFPSKNKERSIAQRYRDFARHEFLTTLRRYFRKGEYPQVVELLSLTIIKDSKKSVTSSQNVERSYLNGCTKQEAQQQRPALESESAVDRS